MADWRDVQWLVATAKDVLARPEEPYLGRMRDAIDGIEGSDGLVVCPRCGAPQAKNLRASEVGCIFCAD